MKSRYTIDGNAFNSLDGFWDHVHDVLIPGYDAGKGLDAFNDILRGGFGTPDDGFIIVWTNAARSRHVLGYPETIAYLEKKLTTCHPSNRADVQDDLNRARNSQGPTLFDIITSIIADHGSHGSESEDGIELVLR